MGRRRFKGLNLYLLGLLLMVPPVVFAVCVAGRSERAKVGSVPEGCVGCSEPEPTLRERQGYLDCCCRDRRELQA